MRKFCAAVALLSLAVLAVGQSALATVNHGNFAGDDVTFIDVMDTSNSGDPEPLFGAPTGSPGNSLQFSPNNFLAQMISPGTDYTGGLLRMDIESNDPFYSINQLNIFEFGDLTLLDPIATDQTGVYASMAGGIRVEAINGVDLSALDQFTIPFNAGSLINGFFSNAALGDFTFDRSTQPNGTQTWSGTVSVNIQAAMLLEGYAITDRVTRVELALDNDLYAYLSGTGISSKLQKKFVDGPSIIVEVIPEPGTFALVCGGLLALSVRARNRRA
jgi:hypothetical protein